MTDANRPRCEHQWVYPMENCTTCMKTEIAELKAKLAQAEIRALEWCKGLMNNDGHCTTGAHDVIDIRIAKLKSKEIANG